MRRGDSSADFSFASFYPGPMQPAVDRVAGVFSSVFRLHRPAAAPSTGATAQAPAAKSAEASRRRWPHPRPVASSIRR